MKKLLAAAIALGFALASMLPRAAAAKIVANRNQTMLRASKVLAAVVAVGLSSARDAQGTNWRAGPLSNDLFENGANSSVGATLSWYPDGGGFDPPRLVVAGLFSSIEGMPADGIAMLNSLSSEWDPLGGGPGFDVQALTVWNGDLIAGGGFVGAAGGRVSRWNGTTWQDLGAEFNDIVRSVGVYNGQLIAGGFFTSVGGVGTPAIAVWDGTAWQSLGGGMGGLGSRVLVMTVYNGELIVGGAFGSAGGQPAANLARWNGSSWQGFGGGVDGVPAGVEALSLYNGELIVGGYFDAIDGVPLNNIGRWNGSIWRSLGNGIEGCGVRSLAYSVGTLVAGGIFNAAGGVPVSNIARWNGSTWQAIGGGVGTYTCQVGGDQVISVADYGGEVIAGGVFTSAGGQPARNLTRWNGVQWTSFGGGSATITRAFAQLGSRLVGGGFFDQSTSTGFRAFNIAAYNGAFLTPLGTGMNDWVIALESHTYPITGDDELVAGGAFTIAGGVSTNRIARWIERDIGFPPQAWEPMGAGFNNAVYALKRYNDIYYAGGAFTSSSGTTVNRIARWNEATGTWEPLGTGMNGPVYALEEYNGELYAGGEFTTAGGVNTGGLARWNGSSWSPVGSAFNGSVYALEVHSGSLVIGGQHSEVLFSSNVAKWNGSEYSPMDSGANNIVYSLVSSDGSLYAGGDFTSPGPRLARWGGRGWSEFGGADGSVRALGAFNGQIHVGGLFSTVDTPAIDSPCWAKFHGTNIPFIVIPPVSRTVPQGGSVFFTVVPADGYEPLAYQWFKDNAPITNGPTGTGSEIFGATTDELHLANVSWFDQGAYSVVVSNAAGADTSAPRALTVIGPTGVPESGSPASASVSTTAIESAWPNPTRGAMRIALRLAHESDVSVGLYDVSGRLVRHLPMGRLPAGPHEAVWDGLGQRDERLSPGVYFLRLESEGSGPDARRVVLLR